MQVNQKPVEQNFLQRWIWSNAFALCIGLGIGYAWINFAALFFLFMGGDTLLYRAMILVGSPLGAAAAGGVLGFVQRPLLQKYISTKYWLLATILGTAIGGLFAVAPYTGVVFGVASYTLLPLRGVVGNTAMFGAWLGIIQWLALRSYVFRSGYWILAYTIGGVLAGGIVDVTMAVVAMLSHSPITIGNVTFSAGAAMAAETIAFPVSVFAGCVVASVITGVTLRWLFHYPKHSG